MFRPVRRTSSGALTVFAASGLHTPVVKSEFPLGSDYGRSPQAYVSKPEAANIVRAPDDERRIARNMLSL
jgi:hypothetical protein